LSDSKKKLELVRGARISEAIGTREPLAKKTTETPPQQLGNLKLRRSPRKRPINSTKCKKELRGNGFRHCKGEARDGRLLHHFISLKKREKIRKEVQFHRRKGILSPEMDQKTFRELSYKGDNWEGAGKLWMEVWSNRQKDRDSGG